jgi:mRNA interferase RelE/StbE
MTFKVTILPRALKQLNGLPEDVQRRLSAAINALAIDPRPAGCAKLSSSTGWRIRIGNYRIIYHIDEADYTIIVAKIGHRRDVYRSLN